MTDITQTTEAPTATAATVAPTERPRNIAYARVWTAQSEPITPVQLYDALYGRGFMPGFTDPAYSAAPLTEVGLDSLTFTAGGESHRLISLTSGKGNGCLVTVDTCDASDLPDHYIARRTVPRPKLVYIVQAGGQSNNDRVLCENIAEVLLLMTGGLVEIGGLGTKGNRPNLYHSSWLNTIKAQSV
jgi:hypothetical protein